MQIHRIHPGFRMIALALGGSLLLTSACGGDGETDSGETGADETMGDTSGDGDGDPTGDGDASGDGDGDGDPTGDGDATGDGDGDPTGDGDATGDGDGDGDCMAWAVEYSLDGSVFSIDASIDAGDADLTCQAPYDDASNIGPGSLTLLMTDAGGAPGDGIVLLTDYAFTMNFAIDTLGTVVTQTLEVEAGDTCGAAAGSVAGGVLAWSPNSLTGYSTTGNINCSGGFCGIAGAPASGDTPVDTNVDIDPFSVFTFTNGIDTFTAPPFTTSSDSQATTTVTLRGSKVSETLVAAPACACQ